MSDDKRRYFSAVPRNRDPILEVLSRVLPKRGTVLEIASGSGEHGVHFATHLPEINWIPTDADHELLASINAWREFTLLPNLLPAVHLDVLKRPWPSMTVDAVVNINMLQVSPWSACEALFEGTEQSLRPGGLLFMYGPYRRQGAHTSPSNAIFDASVRETNPEWGVRNLEDVAAVAERHKFQMLEVVDMPANNLAVIYELQSPNTP